MLATLTSLSCIVDTHAAQVADNSGFPVCQRMISTRRHTGFLQGSEAQEDTSQISGVDGDGEGLLAEAMRLRGAAPSSSKSKAASKASAPQSAPPQGQSLDGEEGLLAEALRLRGETAPPRPKPAAQVHTLYYSFSLWSETSHWDAAPMSNGCGHVAGLKGSVLGLQDTLMRGIGIGG